MRQIWEKVIAILTEDFLKQIWNIPENFIRHIRIEFPKHCLRNLLLKKPKQCLGNWKKIHHL